VVWDRGPNGMPLMYPARELEIGIRGGFWLRAFYKFRADDPVIDRINMARARRGMQ
jgi:hypothetical protein